MNKDTIERMPDLLRRLVDDYLSANNRIDELVTLVDKLGHENMELTAHVERLRHFLKDCVDYDVDEDYLPIHKGELGFMLDETPKQSLSEIKAQAINEFVEDRGDELVGDMNFTELHEVCDGYVKLLVKSK